ncbi:TlpA family protein disulfide reductase [Chitinophaga alhagiae]|uniref:TlpA family protein disulfide reductase n=1 Tax=Chitinophaga alhagiae TaxID=2203219 RepID=UPI000E5B751E|nr:TlpA disulfide reductase family protein [Chitinophaga alhagiae]
MHFLLLFMSAILLCCTPVCIAQQPGGFTLKGRIVDLPTNSKLYLVQDTDTLAIATSQGESFLFIGHIDGQANYYFLKLDTSITNKGSEALWLTNKNMELTGTLKTWPKLELSGSAEHLEYKKMMKISDSSLTKEEKLLEYKKFVLHNPNSLYAPHLLTRISGLLSSEEISILYSGLTEKAKASHYGELLHNNIKGSKSSNWNDTSNDITYIQDFTITDTNGSKRSILDIAKNSQYTLIDFWASWCAPCRSAIPLLKKAYEDFHPKGFNILGISIDKNKEKWQEAVKIDSTKWVHGLDNVQEANKYIFGLSAIPAYILVDKNGKIIRSTYISKTVTQTNQNNLPITDLNLYQTIAELIQQ